MLAAVLTLFAIPLGSGLSAPNCQTVSQGVEKVVSSKARELRGTENCQSRIYHTLGDVDLDKLNDFLLVFSVEGAQASGNRTFQFLAVFPSSARWKASVFQVGETGVRRIRALDVDKGVIAMETDEFRRGDPPCCATGKGQLRFRLVNGQLAGADVPGEDCERHLKQGRAYKDWHKGPTLQFDGQIAIKETFACPEGTCFRAEMTFEDRRSGVDIATGHWAGPQIEFRRYVDSDHYTQSWRGECQAGSVEGTWFREVNQSDTGPFSIKY